MGRRHHAHHGVCGFDEDCPTNYSLVAVNRSAQQWDDDAAIALRSRHAAARAACSVMGHAMPVHGRGAGNHTRTLHSGGWCLSLGQDNLNGDSLSAVLLPGNHSYFLPPRHLAASSAIVRFLESMLKVCVTDILCQAPMCDNCAEWRFLSVTDFGAGVGQYGHALQSRDPRYRWIGYDGAGNIEAATNGYVRFCDLSLPLSLRRTDWVLSLEVGEHVPRASEEMFVRNIHAHNCRGVVLSWASLGKSGVGHTNLHSSEYLINLFTKLGYRYHNQSTNWLRREHLSPGNLRHAHALKTRNISAP